MVSLSGLDGEVTIEQKQKASSLLPMSSFRIPGGKNADFLDRNQQTADVVLILISGC